MLTFARNYVSRTACNRNIQISTFTSKNILSSFRTYTSQIRCTTRSRHPACYLQSSYTHTSNFFSSTSLKSQSNSEQSTSFADPNRSDMFYHLLQPPTPLSPTIPAFALSFLATPPPGPDSCTIIGWLPAQAQLPSPEFEDGMAQEQEAGLHDFKENPEFVDILHTSIKDALRDEADEIQINGAKQMQEGWMHIHDQRNVPALGRIGDPDDIIASVLVKDSKIVWDTYQAMPSYRICTADGVMQLTPGLAQRLNDALARIAETENATIDP